jgi:hypothetical protein
MGLIDANQLKDAFASTSSTTEEYAGALKKAMQIALEQPLIPYDDPSELLIKSGYSPNSTVVNSGTTTSSPINTSGQTIVALQCRSCGGVIDKNTMTCKHCGMTYMLVNSSEINPRLLYPNF